jgi:hypothetical protein
MNPYYGYQLYQAERAKTRVEILADDARLGCQAAAVFRGSRVLAGKSSSPGIMALNRSGPQRLRSRPAPHDGDRVGSPASRNLSRRGTRDH